MTWEDMIKSDYANDVIDLDQFQTEIDDLLEKHEVPSRFVGGLPAPRAETPTR